MKWTKKKITDAVKTGSKIIGYALEVAPTGPVGRVLGYVLADVIPRTLDWFTMTPKQIQHDALYKVMRKPLKSRILLERERARRQEEK